MSFNLLLQAAGPSSSQGFMMTIMPFVLIIIIFYFFIIRPQNKKQKDTEKMISALKKGDKVVTIGGIHGVISSTKEKTIIVKVDDTTKLELNRSAISNVVSGKEPVAKADKKVKASEKKDESPVSDEVSSTTDTDTEKK
ncbi:MAG: preprotein translocase subunit YajC [Treponema sp.]|jgi:preprotein translocase subunit YajC|nr:preprotein translocase subunit YajC [Treponema sp.]